jgi:tRNA (cytidine32/uridine32-2'-O)-methyltransferase
MTQPLEHPHFSKIRIVLVNTSHPGNIGATARAMKNMGLSRLYLVDPHDYPSLEAFRRSAGAIDILDNAVRVSSLSEAIGDCVWVAATSARLRTVEWPLLEPEECVGHSLEYLEQGEVAIVFGRENNGLTNDELEQCNALLHIPTNPEYSSLNVAAAVQVVSYEYRKALVKQKTAKRKGKKYQKDALASNEQLNGLYDHMHETLRALEFYGKNNPDVMMRRIKGMFNRMQATQREVAIMRGICSTIEKKIK